MAAQRSTSPVDEDLQRLYNEVWAGFADEGTNGSNEKDLDVIYNTYGYDNATNPTATPAAASAPAATSGSSQGVHYSAYYSA